MIELDAMTKRKLGGNLACIFILEHSRTLKQHQEYALESYIWRQARDDVFEGYIFNYCHRTVLNMIM